jgi:hypothetical protein
MAMKRPSLMAKAWTMRVLALAPSMVMTLPLKKMLSALTLACAGVFSGGAVIATIGVLRATASRSLKLERFVMARLQDRSRQRASPHTACQPPFHQVSGPTHDSFS